MKRTIYEWRVLGACMHGARRRMQSPTQDVLYIIPTVDFYQSRNLSPIISRNVGGDHEK